MRKRFISLIQSLAFIGLTLQSAPVSANDFGIVGTAIALNERQCRKNYRTMDFDEMLGGGCFDSHNPYSKCLANVSKYDELRSITDRDCLKIFHDVARNKSGSESAWNASITFGRVKKLLAINLSRNELYMETLDKLDQAELKRLGK